MSNTPSDAELDALRQADNGALNFVTLRQFRTIARAVLAKWGTPQPVVREPLTEEQISAMSRKHPAEDLCGWSYRLGIADAEAHHGIKQKGGSHDL